MGESKINIQGGLCEFFGTYLFLFIINCIGSNPVRGYNLVGVALGIGIGLSIIVCIMAGVSGGCINPAVSLAVFLSDKKALSLYNLLIHIFAQILGALLGALTSYGVTGKSFAFTPSPFYGYRHVVGSEIVMSAMLCYTVLAVALDKAGGDAGPLFIGLVVTVGVFAIGPISGACLNPAVVFGINVVNAIDGGTFYAKDFFTYLLCPLAGSLIAVVVFVLTRWDKYTMPTKTAESCNSKEQVSAPLLESLILPKHAVYRRHPDKNSRNSTNVPIADA